MNKLNINKNIIIIAIALIFVIVMSVCYTILRPNTPVTKNGNFNSFNNQVWVEPNREIWLYTYNGDLIRKYRGTIKYDRNSAWINIITNDNKSILVRDGIVIVE